MELLWCTMCITSAKSGAQLTTFILFDEEGSLIGEFKYNSIVSFEEGCALQVVKDTKWKSNASFDIDVEHIPLSDLVESYKTRLTVSPFGKNTSVVELSFVDPIAEKAEDFLDMLVTNYNNDAIADKKFRFSA